MLYVYIFQISHINEALHDLAVEREILVEHPTSVLNRKQHPTTNNAGDLNIAKRTSTKRRSETFEAAMRIHGGTATNTLPAAAGLIDMLTTKFSQKNLVNVISRKRK